MASAAPKNSHERPADHITVIAAGAVTNVNLTTISRRPQHAAQRLRVVNNNAAAQPFVFRGEDDTADTTINVPLNSYVDIDTPVKSLTSAGTNVEVHCYWWAGNDPNRNK